MTEDDKYPANQRITDLVNAYKVGTLSSQAACIQLAEIMSIPQDVAEILLKHIKKNNILKISDWKKK